MTGWQQLTEELDRWQAAGRLATLWWRDDDARSATPELAQLLDLRRTLGCPLALAVIPSGADGSLAEALSAEADIVVMQHGYAHANHAAAGQAKIELGGRETANIAAELTRGRDMLATLFGGPPPDLMVPPWNRIDPDLPAMLPALGYRGLSTFRARTHRQEEALTIVNTHIDIIDWPITRSFCGDREALDQTCRHLRDRRTGAVDDAEPTGLLTHHLAHDAGCWKFIDAFVQATTSHPAVRWITATEAFGAAR